jgi:hypothetical protein
MIPAPEGIYATYHTEDREAGPGGFVYDAKVVAFDNEGYALIASDSDEKGRLTRACDIDGFVAISATEPEYTAIIPANGWRIKFKASGTSSAIAGWALTRRGTVIPLVPARDGYVPDWSDLKDEEYRIYYKPSVEITEIKGIVSVEGGIVAMTH